MIMKKEFKGANELEIGKDYISQSGGIITIDRKGNSNSNNNGFRHDNFADNIVCEYPDFWREATEEEVIAIFEAHLIKRYGADWEIMKIKEQHPYAASNKNDGLWCVVISKFEDGWGVYNKNGLLYYKGIWVERLEEEANINMTDLIKNIQDWASDRNLNTQDPKIQMCKTMEELGELANAINKGNKVDAMDGIGDVVVTLICISMQLDLDFNECLKMAYDEIKGRKGKMIDGVFVKEEDLK